MRVSQRKADPGTMQVLLGGPRATLAVAPERGARPISTTLNLTPAYWARSCRLTFKCEHHHIYRMADKSAVCAINDSVGKICTDK